MSRPSTPSNPNPIPVLVTYLPKPGKAEELGALVARHGPMLRRTGLISPEPVRAWRAQEKRERGGAGEPYFVEMFQWRDADAPGIAHQTPEVMSVWEPMGNVMQELRIVHLEPFATTS